MNILAFDTSTPIGSVALRVNNQELLLENHTGQKNSEWLLPTVNALLKQASISFSDIDLIAFGSGPGSFMGVRLAVSVAQALGFAHGAPLVEVPSLQTIAQAAYQETKSTNICVAWDARMQEMYCCEYVLQKGIMQPVYAEALLSAKDACMPTKKNTVLAGNGWQIYNEAFLFPIQDFVICNTHPRADTMLFLAEEKYFRNETVLPENTLPRYVRNQVAHKN